jgi:hypothetical protein
MATVQAFCDRALLIHDGEQHFLGEPEEATLRYYRLNFAGTSELAGGGTDVRLLEVWLEDDRGNRIENVGQGQRFHFNLLVEARTDLPAPSFAFELLNVDDVSVLGFGIALEHPDGKPRPMRAGQRLKVAAALDNPLVPGRYAVVGSISRSRDHADMVLHDLRLTDFLVTGTKPAPGMVFVRADVQATIEAPR